MSIDLAQSLFLHIRDNEAPEFSDAALASHFNATPAQVGDALAFLHDAGLIETAVNSRTVRVKVGA